MNKDEEALHLKHCEQLIASTHGYIIKCSATGYYGGPPHHLYIGARIWLPLKVDLPTPYPPRPGSKHSNQFAGIHEHLVITYRRPRAWDNLVRISTEVPAIVPFGRVIWLGRCTVKKRPEGDGKHRGYSIDIPSSTWLAPEPHFRHQRVKLIAIVHSLSTAVPPHFSHLFLEFPALTRDLFFDVSIL